jgi:Fe-S-cluster containining protein
VLFTETLLHDLAGFYEKLDRVLLPSNRACGSCGECCRNLSMLRVYPLELQNIRRYIHNDKLIKKFEDFSNSRVIKIWGDIEAQGHCPFQAGDLCTIYHVRPYFCRVYGHYNNQGNSLLKECVYTGHSRGYLKREELPLYAELLQLVERKPQLVMC